MRTVWTFHTAGQLLFGRHAVRQLADIAARLNARRVLVVTDPILVKAGLADAVREPLTAAGLASLRDGTSVVPPPDAGPEALARRPWEEDPALLARIRQAPVALAVPPPEDASPAVGFV